MQNNELEFWDAEDLRSKCYDFLGTLTAETATDSEHVLRRSRYGRVL